MQGQKKKCKADILYISFCSIHGVTLMPVNLRQTST